ncbi:MAG: DUF4350 domain-containing protein, partial [Chloroflexi bacterium]|nr:DUF4350 domain-containing protein [Chloroflexota bacterium]
LIMQDRFTFDYLAISLVLLGLFAVLGFSIRRQLEPLPFAPGSSQNDSSDGTTQLMNGLQDLGYLINIQTVGTIRPTAQDAIVMILSPNSDYASDERNRLNEWINQGGTLILAADNNQASDLLSSFDLTVQRTLLPKRTGELVLPTLNWPFVGEANIQAKHRLALDCGQAAIHIGDCKRPFLISFGRGNGQVYVLSSLYPFTNVGLENERNAQLVRNLVQLNAAVGSTILVDDLHRRSSALWLVQSPGGWAILLTLLFLTLFVMRYFQPFGKPRPKQNRDQPDRRETAVFIKELAAAQNQLDPNRRIRDHYWQRLKRKLAIRHGLDPGMYDQQFLEALTPYHDQKTVSILIHLMVSMDRHQINELELQRWTTLLLNLKDALENPTVETAVHDF